MNGIPTRSARSRDLAAVATVHAAAFAGFFLARMGACFLRAYYGLVLDYPGGVLLVAGRGEEIGGFVAGCVDPADFYAHMARSRRRLLGPMLRAVLRRPSLLPRVLFNRSRVMAAAGPSDPETAELTSIGVDPQSAGSGLGRTLVEAFCAEAARRGARRVVLTTDADGNDAVNAFYLRNGFVLERTFRSGPRRRMNAYVRRLDQAL